MALEDARRLERGRAGLCVDCAYVQRVETVRGAVFYRCRRSDDDERFPKYPVLPVIACVGFESGTAPIERSSS